MTGDILTFLKYPDRKTRLKRLWYVKNKERINNQPSRKKAFRKYFWKKRGLCMDNFEAIYQRYLATTHCDLCGVELSEDKLNTKTTKAMDHDHYTGQFRNILCMSCNSKLPTQPVIHREKKTQSPSQ